MCVHTINSPCAICSGALLPNMAVVIESDKQYAIGIINSFNDLTQEYVVNLNRTTGLMRWVRAKPEKVILAIGISS